jgi:predicted alpha/beta hydrolase
MMEKVELHTQDGLKLAGMLFTCSNPKAIIQFNSATAVLKEFYISFAKALQEDNFSVLLYEYRGIGESKPKTGLKDCGYQYTDWAKYDMAAALNFCVSRFPSIPLLWMGHSVGGQMIGLVPNLHNRVKAMLTVNTGSGYGGNMNFKNRMRNIYFFEIIRPISLLFFGYGKLKQIGLMEDIPKNIYNDWRKWCSVPEYFFNPKFSKNIEGIEGFQNLNFPVEVYTAIDDEIATKKNVESFWQFIRSKQAINFNWLNPKDYNVSSIGHFDLFRKKNKEALWPIVINKLNELNDENDEKK